jgi:adenylate kinase family enzyme
VERVLIVGCPGAGKSAVAKSFATKTGLPVIHLGYHYWQPGWAPSEKEIWREKVLSLAAQPRWIMDGNYGSTFDERLERADTLIHLNFSTWICFWRVIRRTIANLGQEREGEFVAGCPERFDGTFLRFVLLYRHRYRARDVAKLSAFRGRRFTFDRPAALAGFLESVR